jgi:hypothetical protein
LREFVLEVIKQRHDGVPRSMTRLTHGPGLDHLPDPPQRLEILLDTFASADAGRDIGSHPGPRKTGRRGSPSNPGILEAV